jgi:DNA invertase Pin-like site-specific DNA recombinase
VISLHAVSMEVLRETPVRTRAQLYRQHMNSPTPTVVAVPELDAAQLAEGRNIELTVEQLAELREFAAERFGLDPDRVVVGAVANPGRQVLRAAERKAAKRTARRVRRPERNEIADVSVEVIAMRVRELAESEFEKTMEQVERFVPLILWVRISKDDFGTSMSPGDQIDYIAWWCAEHGFIPVDLKLELAQTAWAGRISERSDRPVFFDFEDEIQDGRAASEDVACLVYDRFARDTQHGSRVVNLMFRKGMNLHSIVKGAPTVMSHEKVADIERGFVTGQEESGIKSARILRSRRRRAVAGDLINNYTGATGHLVSHMMKRGRGGMFEKQEALWIDPEWTPFFRECLRAAKHRHRSLYSIVTEWNGSGRRMPALRDEDGNLLAEGAMLECSTIKRILGSPRMSGCQECAGEWWPSHLIEPIYTPEEHKLILAWLAPKQKTGKKSTYTYSGAGDCSCGDHLVGGNGRYQCARSADRNLPRAGGKPWAAADGNRHSALDREIVDRLLDEVGIAFYGANPRHDEHTRVAETIANAGEEVALDAYLAEKAEKKRSINRWNQLYAEEPGNVSKVERDTNVSQLRAEIRKIDAQLTALLPQSESPERVPDGVSVRDYWEQRRQAKDVEWLRAMVAQALRFTIQPQPQGAWLAPEYRVSFEFGEGVVFPVELLNAIRDSLIAQRRLANADVRHGSEPPRELCERIFRLYDVEGMPATPICRLLTAEGVAPPRGQRWWATSILNIVKREYARCGRPFESRDVQIDQATRTLIRMLVEEGKRLGKGEGFTYAAETLNNLAGRHHTQPNGKPWTAGAIASALRHTGRRSGPKPSIPENVQVAVFAVYRRKGTKEAMRWLADEGYHVPTRETFQRLMRGCAQRQAAS